jgi:hypothetical protein
MTPATPLCPPFVSTRFPPARSFTATLPLQQMTALQTLCLQQIHIRRPAAAAAAAECDPPLEPPHMVQPSQLTRLIIDSSLSSLFWALRGEGLRQLCCNVEELEVGAGPHDSSTEGQEWGEATDHAFMSCYRACPRLRTLRVASQFVSSWVGTRTNYVHLYTLGVV